MKGSLTKKILSCLISAIILLNPLALSAQDSAETGGLFDDSLHDITMVLGVGAVGAILGLSTLSFVEKPKDNLKNVAIGGAVGIVIGVGIVIFGQATKSQSTMMSQLPSVPVTADTAQRLARQEFGQERIAQNYLDQTTLGLNFSF